MCSCKIATPRRSLRWGESRAVFTHEPPHEETGVLELGIGIGGTKSVAKRQYHEGAFKIIRPHYLDDSGQVYYITVNPGGGYVGGDSYDIAVSVDDGASVLLTDQSATKVYRTPGSYVSQNLHFKVGAGAVLEYIPDQLILYRDADFRQHMTVEVDPEGHVFLSDIVTPGWSPDKEMFRYRQAHLRSTVRVGDKLALVDNMRIQPMEEHEEIASPTFLGENTHFATAICFDPQVDEDLIAQVRDAISEVEGVQASVTPTDVPGFVLRGVADRTEHLMEVVLRAAHVVRSTLRGQGKVHLRQY